MARLIGPSEASREVKTIVTLAGVTRDLFKSKAGRLAKYFVDPDPTAEPTLGMLTTLADIRSLAGVPYVAGTVTIDAYSMLPLMQFPDNVDSLLIQVDNGPPWRVYAREDDRLDAAAAAAAAAQTAAAAAQATANGRETPAGAQEKADGARDYAVQRANHTGTQSADTLTDGGTNRLFTSAEKTKLSGVASGATANATDAQLRDRAGHTGTQSADTVVDGTTNKAYTAAEKSKLGGVASGATANSTDAQLRDRSLHTGSQATSTVTGLDAALDAARTAGAVIQAVGLDTTGAADATAAIQAAINLAPTTAGAFTFLSHYRGLVVQLPPGRLRITGQITMRPGVTLQGAGKQATVLVNEGTTNHVLYFLGTVGGTIAPLGFNNFAIAQKSGVTHTAGNAIHIDGGGYGCTVKQSQTSTYGTFRGSYYRDVYLSEVEGCEGYLHATNGFLTDVLCTSINFKGCYAGANTGSGYKIFGNYMTLNGCGSDSNALDGYEVYYNGGSTVSIAFIGCGSEGSGRNGIAIDRGVGVTISSPRLIAPVGSNNAGIKLDGGNGITIIAPVISSLQANSSTAITLTNASGVYPIGTTLIAMSQATNYAGLFDVPERVFHISDQTAMGLGAKGLRIGPITNFTADLQSLFVGSAPAGSGAIAYGLHSRPVAGAALTTFAAVKTQPEINAPALSVSRAIGTWASSPVITSGSLTRAEGMRIDDITGGSTANANLAMGATVPATGNWAIWSASTRDSLLSGPLQLANVGAPPGTPTGGVVIYAEAGSLKCKGSSGTVTVLGPA